MSCPKLTFVHLVLMKTTFPQNVAVKEHADYDPVNELALVFVLGLESKALYILSFQGDLFISMHHSFKTSVFLHIA